MSEVGHVRAALFQLLDDLTKDRVLSFMVNLACLCILHGLSPVDIYFRRVSIGERRKLPVDNLVDSCGDTEALALVMIA